MAQNVVIVGSNTSLVRGTIGTNGTASEIFDLAGNTLLGLLGDNLSTGTFNFEVAHNDPFNAPPSVQPWGTLGAQGTLRLLRNLDATVVATGSLTDNIALTENAMHVLAPYRYVRIVASAAQANAPTFTFITKA
jgi:hypothetical protein